MSSGLAYVPAAGDEPSGGDFRDIVSAINALNVAQETTNTTANTATSGTTELMQASATFTAVAGVDYEVTVEGPYEGSVAAAAWVIALRWAAGGSVAITDTKIRGIPVINVAASAAEAFSISGVISGAAAGPVTVGVSLKRTAGTGVGKMNATVADQTIYFRIRGAGLT